MTRIQFGFCMPADTLDKQRRATFSDDLNRTFDLVAGHFDSAWIIDHLKFGNDDMLEGFIALSYMAALHPQLTFGHSVLCQSFRCYFGSFLCSVPHLRLMRSTLGRPLPPLRSSSHSGILAGT